MPDLVDKLGLSNPMANGSRVSQAKFSPHCHRLVFGTISFYSFQSYASIQAISYTLCLACTAPDFALLKTCSLDDFTEESCCQIQTAAQAQKGGHRQGQALGSNQTPGPAQSSATRHSQQPQ